MPGPEYQNAYGSLTSRPPKIGRDLSTNVSLPSLDRKGLGLSKNLPGTHVRNSLSNAYRKGSKTTTPGVHQNSLASKYNRNFQGSSLRNSQAQLNNQSLLNRFEKKGPQGKSMAAIDSKRLQTNNSEAPHHGASAMEALTLSGQIHRNAKESPSRLLGKPFADIRVKLGQKKSPQRYEVDNESEPSNISDDMWGEIPKYNHMKYQ